MKTATEHILAKPSDDPERWTPSGVDLQEVLELLGELFGVFAWKSRSRQSRWLGDRDGTMVGLRRAEPGDVAWLWQWWQWDHLLAAEDGFIEMLRQGGTLVTAGSFGVVGGEICPTSYTNHGDVPPFDSVQELRMKLELRGCGR